MKNIILYVIILNLKDGYCWLPELWGEQYNSALMILRLTSDVLKDTNQRIGHLSDISQRCQNSAAFEVGYLTYVIQEKYRRMVDKYYSAVMMKIRFYLNEHVLALEEVEIHYWEIEHIANMLHEIERKYNVKSAMDAEYVMETTETTTSVATMPIFHGSTRSRKKKKKFNINDALHSSLTRTTTKKPKWWPIEYGWEIDYYW